MVFKRGFFPSGFCSAYMSYNPFLKRERIKRLDIYLGARGKKNENLKKKIFSLRCCVNITIQLPQLSFENNNTKRVVVAVAGNMYSKGTNTSDKCPQIYIYIYVPP